MGTYNHFSKKKRMKQDGDYQNVDSKHSYDPIKDKKDGLHTEEWEKYISYYRKYIDKFCIEVLGLKLYLFQRLILRAMARNQYVMLICCRGLGKSWLSAVFFVASCILYKGLKCGIASGQGQQARNVIIQKVKGELAKNPSIAREIVFPIKTGADDCVVNFRNGSEIRAIVLGRNQGDGARSWRFHYLLVDECRLVSDKVINTILIPMTKTKRAVAIHHNKREKGKVIFISSAYLKTSDLYKRFKYFCDKMSSGANNYFVCSLDYRVGIEAGIFDQDDIDEERNKPDMTIEEFQYEYEGIFVGSSGESYFPYETTTPARVLGRGEITQPKKSKSEYIITHDVAISGASDSDNACTHVIKLKPKPNGTYVKEVVYTKTHNGISLPEQRDFLRELYHLKFPNAVKIVIDMRGNGEPLPSLFYETWEYTNSKTGEKIEFPPLVLDNDDKGKSLNNALPILRGITATVGSNNKMYTYMKASFENGSLRLLKDSVEVDDLFKNKEMPIEEFQFFKQTDRLIRELSNIKQVETDHNNIKYERIDKGTKRDRATSLMYGLSVVQEMEEENRMSLNDEYEDDDPLVYYI
ncbi:MULTISPECIES: terminase large subunit domain-containing protein [Clostridium]|nr:MULTISPECIES: terminase family protein [Clostridium]YP_398598.1 conserved phage-related protein [Clostridium phage c-st]BAE47866.1 conserved phage-related protein [Clostridium phage c-st]CAG7839950.1 hypothetical protein CLOHAE12215_01366 [Clostridium haemolyticum]